MYGLFRCTYDRFNSKERHNLICIASTTQKLQQYCNLNIQDPCIPAISKKLKQTHYVIRPVIDITNDEE